MRDPESGVRLHSTMPRSRFCGIWNRSSREDHNPLNEQDPRKTPCGSLSHGVDQDERRQET